jgi:hypothetical protein
MWIQSATVVPFAKERKREDRAMLGAWKNLRSEINDSKQWAMKEEGRM